VRTVSVNAASVILSGRSPAVSRSLQKRQRWGQPRFIRKMGMINGMVFS